MSRSLFHSITIKIPSEMVLINKKTGSLKLVPTLTTLGRLTKRDGKPSIILKKDDYIVHPTIENGETVNYNEMKEQHIKLQQIKKK
jgi:hypothetical protein